MRLHELLTGRDGVGLEDMERAAERHQEHGRGRLIRRHPSALEAAKKQGAELEAVDTLTELGGVGSASWTRARS